MIFSIYISNVYKWSCQYQKLTELRYWLLPMLMNGPVTIGEVKRELGMVAEEQTGEQTNYDKV